MDKQAECEIHDGFCYEHQVWIDSPWVGAGRFTLSPCNPEPVVR
jgi:hypothetical protein